MNKILVSSLLVPLIACVNYKDTFTKNLNNTGAYVANSASNTISQYSVDSSTFALKELGTVAAGTTPVYVAMHPNSKFVYAVNNGSNTISVYSVSTTTRKLTLASTTSVDAGPVYIIFNSAGTYAYVASTVTAGNSTLTSFVVSTSTGALTQLGTYTPGTDAAGCTTPVDMAIAGSVLYLACNSTTNFYVIAYLMNSSTGGLTYVSNLSSATTINLTYITPSTTGTSIFAAQTDGSLGYELVNGDGTFNGTPTSITNSGTNAVGIYFNSAGTLMWVVNKGSNNVLSYVVSGSGTTFGTPTTSTVGTSPTAMTFAGNYAYAYVVNSGDNTVSLYSVNSSTGALTLSSTIATGTTPTNLVGY